MAKAKKVVKVRVVRFKGKDAIIESLKTVLSELEHWTSFDEVEDEDEGIVYRYEELHVTGHMDGVYVAITCDYGGCKVEAPIYNFLAEPCRSKPTPTDVVNCVKTVVSRVKEVERSVKELQAMVQELSEHGFEIRKVLGGAEAYWSSTNGETRSHIRVHLSPRTSILQLQVEGEPAKIIGIARVLTKLVR